MDQTAESIQIRRVLPGDRSAVLQLIDTVATPLQLAEGSRVCDVGCGYGGTSKYLAEHYEFAVTGSTMSS